MADPLDKNTIDMLAAAFDKAMKSQGGSRPYDQKSWGDRRSPAELAADMKKADRTEKTILGVMTKLQQGMKTQGKSYDQLSDTLKASTQSVKKSMDIFGHNFEKAEKEFVKALTKTIESNDGMNRQLRALAGNIEKMEDVFTFDELTKAMVDMTEQMEKAKNHETSGKAVAERLMTIQKHLDKTGQAFEDIDPMLKDFDKVIDEISSLNASNERTYKNQEEVGHVLKDWLKNNKISPDAQQRIKDLGLAGVGAAAEKAAKGLQYHASIRAAATNKLKAFAEKTFTAANALDLLIKAATRWYSTTKEAFGTGTEKGFGATLARDARAVYNGVDPKVLQEVQVKNAMARNNMGRKDFDNQTYAGVNELTRITGDRNESLKLQASLQSSMAKANMDFSKMPDTIHKLSDSFLKLQYETGMTAEQFGQMNEEFLSDGDIRRQMLNLSDKEKAAMIVAIDKRVQENVQLGYSIDQTKEQIKLLNQLFNPLDPKNRYKNSVKTEVFMRTQGMGGAEAHDVSQIGLYGQEQYKKTLMAGGLSDKDASDRIAKAQKDQAGVYKNTQAKLAGPNLGQALYTQGLMDSTGQTGTATSQAWLNGTPQTKQGNDEFKDAVGDFSKAVDSFSNKLTSGALGLGDRAGALKNSIIGPAIGGIVAAVVAKRLGMFGMAKGFLKSGGIGKLFGKGAAAAEGVAEGAAHAGPEIELVNGIPRAKAAAETVTGVKAASTMMKGARLASAAKIGGKMLKGGPGGILASLALMGAQSYFGEKSTTGKILNSNTVNGASTGAGVGGMIGAAFGGIGAVPGAAIGGAIGGIGGAAMDAWDYFHQPKPESVSTVKVNTTKTTDRGGSFEGFQAWAKAHPEEAAKLRGPQTNFPEDGIQSPPERRAAASVNTADGKKADGQEPDKRGDPQVQTVDELKKQNSLLTNILNELKGHTDAINDNGNKSVGAMTKLQRAMKSMGNGDADLVAASKYN